MLRWVVPAFAAVAVGGSATVGAIVTSAQPSLPPRTAAQLLVDLQAADVDGLTGTVVQRAELGLPDLPDSGGQADSDLAALVSGTNTLRVWYAGPGQARVALLGTLSQTDVIRNGSDLWVWESGSNHASHWTLPPELSGTGRAGPVIDPGALPMTPQEAADAALATIDPSTVVSTEGTARVAGRDAYELVLSPRDDASLVDQVRLAIDAEKHVPLRVQVYADDAGDPAFEIRFVDIGFDPPDPEQFRFNPPPGATVTDETLTGDDLMPSLSDVQPQDAPRPRFTVVGDGWTSVLVTRVVGAGPSSADERRLEEQVGGLLSTLPTVNGAWGGGRMLSGRLFSVLFTDDGRTLVGAVTPERLTEVAADPAAQLEHGR